MAVGLVRQGSGRVVKTPDHMLLPPSTPSSRSHARTALKSTWLFKSAVKLTFWMQLIALPCAFARPKVSLAQPTCNATTKIYQRHLARWQQRSIVGFAGMGRPFAVEEDEEPNETETVQSWIAALEQVGPVSSMSAGQTYQDPKILRFLGWLYKLKRTAYTMEVVKAESDLPRTASKVGGLPFLLPDEPWPRNRDASGNHDPEGHEMTFIMQLRIGEMPDDAKALFGVDDGMFQLFFDDELPGFNINTEHDYYLARVIPPEDLEETSSTTTTTTTTNTAEPEDIAVLEEQAVVDWAKHDDWPNFEDLVYPDDLDLDVTVMSDIREALTNNNLTETVSGDKLVGWPRWCQSPEWGLVDGTEERYIHLVQFEAEHASEISIGDSGTLVVQRHPRDTNMFKVGWACC